MIRCSWEMKHPKCKRLKTINPTKDTVESSLTCNGVANILTVHEFKDYPITSGMQTLYLLSVNAPLPRARQILLQGKESHSAGGYYCLCPQRRLPPLWI